MIELNEAELGQVAGGINQPIDGTEIPTQSGGG